jgi:acyl-CoA synthetase (NDP forming)
VSHPLDEILHPSSIAIVGAPGTQQMGPGAGFVSSLLAQGFKGKIYPVNPKYTESEGLKCYASLREIPDTVDYVISRVPAREVPKMLEDAASKGAKAAHLFTARFSETGRPEAAQLEQEILKLARKLGIRIIGPNCMGVYYPAHGLSFGDEFPKESGSIGVASQSGNLSMDLVMTGAMRGLRFSKLISYGNAIDLNESDYLEYFAQDPETKVVLMYIEGVKDGRRFFDTLRRTTAVKPIIILKGGRGQAGARAISSHTASLASALEVWNATLRQTAAILAETLEELIDLAVSFYFSPHPKGKRVGVLGGAGGASVLAADECERAGLEVIQLPQEFREQLKSQGFPEWDWLGNPADFSILSDRERFSMGTIFEMMNKDPHFDLLIIMLRVFRRMHQTDFTLDNIFAMLGIKLDAVRNKPLLSVVPEPSFSTNNEDNEEWKLLRELRSRLIANGIPFYPTIGRAALAARKVTDYYQRKSHPDAS